jgi:hypothetical protein
MSSRTKTSASSLERPRQAVAIDVKFDEIGAAINPPLDDPKPLSASIDQNSAIDLFHPAKTSPASSTSNTTCWRDILPRLSLQWVKTVGRCRSNPTGPAMMLIFIGFLSNTASDLDRFLDKAHTPDMPPGLKPPLQVSSAHCHQPAPKPSSAPTAINFHSSSEITGCNSSKNSSGGSAPTRSATVSSISKASSR